MSDEPQEPDAKRLNWVPASLLTFALLVAYQGAHYATSASILEGLSCCPIRAHTIGGKRVPEWVESFFGPAEWIDERMHLK
jgi:hypothetical protein